MRDLHRLRPAGFTRKPVGLPSTLWLLVSRSPRDGCAGGAGFPPPELKRPLRILLLPTWFPFSQYWRLQWFPVAPPLILNGYIRFDSSRPPLPCGTSAVNTGTWIGDLI